MLEACIKAIADASLEANRGIEIGGTAAPVISMQAWQIVNVHLGHEHQSLGVGAEQGCGER